MKFSVITVNLNNRNGLEKTIQSVIKQSSQDYELIIIDGASCDGSLDIIKQYEKSITLWISERDRGIYHAMNKGISNAKGDYCYFLNSGDYLVSDTLFEELLKLDLYTDIVSGNVLKINQNGKYRICKPLDKPTLHKLCIHSLPHPASLIKRELFNQIGLYNESFKIVSDFDFFLKAIVVFKKTYQKVDINFCYFDMKGMSNNPHNIALVKNETQICLENNFPEIADDLIEYRRFQSSNIGQMIRLLHDKDKLYSFLEKTIGGILKFKRFIVGI